MALALTLTTSDALYDVYAKIDKKQTLYLARRILILHMFCDDLKPKLINVTSS